MKDITIDDIKKLSKQHKLVLGSNEVMKQLRQGKLSQIYLASNIPSDLEEDIRYNAKIAEVVVDKTTLPNDEVGMAFKRAHPVLSIGVIKE